MIRPSINSIDSLKSSLVAALFAAALAVAMPVRAAEEISPMLQSPESLTIGEVKFTQRLDNQVRMDAEFVNDRGERVTLAEVADGKPSVFVLAYYRCPRLCNMVLNAISKSLQAIDFEPGKDFNVIVVSFDPSDTYQIAADKKKSVISAFSRTGDDAGWHFLVGDEESVAEAAESVGFNYVYDEKSGEYAHASGIVLLTPEGRVSRYFYGIDFPTRDVRLGLVEASQGQIGSPVDEILLLCLHYDPSNGRYGIAILNLVRAGGLLTVAVTVGFIGMSLRQDRRKSLTAATTSSAELDAADKTPATNDTRQD